MSIISKNYETGEQTESYVGRVLATETRDDRVMSDIYAYQYYALVVEDDFTTRWVMYSSSFELCIIRGSATVDASAELVELVAMHQQLEGHKKTLSYLVDHKKKVIDDTAQELRRVPKKRDTVRVFKGTPKTPKGTTGVLVWIGTCNYTGAPRAGIKVEGQAKLSYCPLKNVEVADDLSLEVRLSMAEVDFTEKKVHHQFEIEKVTTRIQAATDSFRQAS